MHKWLVWKRRKLKYYGLYKRGIVLRQQGLTYKQIGERFGCSSEVARRVITKQIETAQAIRSYFAKWKDGTEH